MEVEYKKMSRRELQALCKKHGLPANLTNIRMAENLATLLQKASSEEIKRKGCLKGSGGSSVEGAGSGRGVPKKVSFNLQEDSELERGRGDPDLRASPERRRSSRRKSVVDSAPYLQEEDAEEERARRDQNLRASSERRRSSRRKSVVGSVPNLQEEDGEEERAGGDQNLRASPKRRRRKSVIDSAPKEASEPALEAKCGCEVKTKSKRNKSAAAVTAAVAEKKNTRKRNHEVDLVVNFPCSDENNRRKSGTEPDEEAPITRSLRNRVAMVGGSGALQGEAVGKRMETRRNAKKKGEEELGNDEKFEKKAKGGISTLEITEQDESMVSQFEEPPLRQSRSNIAKSCNALQGTAELKTSSVIAGPDVNKLANKTEQEVEAVKLPRRSNRVKCYALRTKEEGTEISLFANCKAIDELPDEVPQIKEKESAKNSDLMAFLPDVASTKVEDVRIEKRPDVASPTVEDVRIERHGLLTHNSCMLDVLEHGTSLPYFCEFGLDHETVIQNKSRKLEQSCKKRRKVAYDNMTPSSEMETTSEELVCQADLKGLSPSENILRCSMHNASSCATMEMEVPELNNHKMTDNIDGFLGSAQPITSTDLSIKNLSSEIKHSNLPDFKSAKEFQPSLSIDSFNATESIKEVPELFPCISVDVSSRTKYSSLRLEDVKEDIEVAEAECSEFGTTTCLNSITGDVNYSEDRDEQYKEKNVRDCHPKEPSPAVAIGASCLSDVRTTSMLVNVDDIGSIASYSAIFASDIKDNYAFPYSTDDVLPSLTVLPGNDLVDSLDQHSILKNEGGSCGDVSVTSTVKSTHKEVYGMEEINGTNDNPQMHAAMAREDIFGYSPSNLSIKMFEKDIACICEKHEEHCERQIRRHVELNALVAVYDGSKVAQDDEIMVFNEENQNNVTGSCSFDTLTNFDSSESSLYEIHEKAISPNHDLVNSEEHMNFSGLKIHCEEKSCCGSLNSLGVISMALSELPVDEVANNLVHMEATAEISSEGKPCADDKVLTSLQAEVENIVVMHLDSSASSILTCKNGSLVDTNLCVNQNRNNEIMDEVGIPSGVGGTLQFKGTETELAEKEDSGDTRPSSNDIFDCSPVNLIRSIGVDKMDSSIMGKSSNSSKRFSISIRKMSNKILQTPGSVSPNTKENHISTSGNYFEGKSGSNQSNNLCPKSARENGVDSTDMNNLNSISEEVNVINKHEVLPRKDPKLQLFVPPLCNVFSGGQNLCLDSCDCADNPSSKRAFPVSILKEDTDVNNDDIITPTKSENPAAFKSLSLELQSPVPYKLSEVKHVVADQDGVGNSGLDTSYSFWSSGNEHLKSFCKESNEIKEKLDRDLVHSEHKQNSPQICGIWGEFQNSSDFGEMSAGTPSGQGFEGRQERTKSSGSIASSEDGSTNFEAEILSPDHHEVSYINDGFLLHNLNVEEKNEKDSSKVFMQAAGHMIFEAKEADEINNMGKKMEMGEDICIHEEDEEEQLILESDNYSENHTMSISNHVTPMDPLELFNISCVEPGIENGSVNNHDDNICGDLTFRTLVITETELAQPVHNLDCNNLISSDAAPETPGHNLDSSQQHITEVAEESLDALGPEVRVVTLIPQHPESEEISKTYAMNDIDFIKHDFEDNECHYGKEFNTTSKDDPEMKTDEIALHQQLYGIDHKAESGEQIDASQANPAIAGAEEVEMENCDNGDGCNSSQNMRNHHEVDDKSASGGEDYSFNNVFDVTWESKHDEIWVPPGATLMFIEDLFHEETKPLFFAQPVITDHTPAEDNIQHECGYSGGISRALNMAEEMAAESIMSDDDVENNYEEKVTSTSMNDDLKMNLVGNVEYETKTQLEASSGCSGSKCMDGLEYLGSTLLDEEKSPKETGIAGEEEDVKSVECFETVAERYLAIEQSSQEVENLNEKALEVSDTLGYENKLIRSVNALGSTVGTEALNEDLAVASALVSSPGASAMVTRTATCEVEKAVQTGETTQALAGSFNMEVDLCTTLNELEPTCVVDMLGDSFSLPNEEVSTNVTDAGAPTEVNRDTKCEMEEVEEVLMVKTKDAPQKGVEFFDLSGDACTTVSELEPTNFLGTPGDSLYLPEEQSNRNLTDAGACSNPGASITRNRTAKCEMNIQQESITRKTNDTPRTSVGSLDNAGETCTALYELASTSILGTLGTTLLLADKPFNTNSAEVGVLSSSGSPVAVNHNMKYVIERSEETITGRINDTSLTSIKSFKVAAETSTDKTDISTELNDLEPRSILSTPKDKLVLPDEQVNSISKVAGSLSYLVASSVTVNHITNCEMEKDLKIIAGNTNETPYTRFRSFDLAADTHTASNRSESRCVSRTTGDELMNLNKTDAEVEAFLQEENLDKVQKLHLATLNMKNLLRKARMVVSSQPMLGMPSVQSTSEHRVPTNDDAMEPPESAKNTGTEWVEEISRKLLDFRISSAKRPSKPFKIQVTPSRIKQNFVNDSVMGKENTPAVRKDYTHKLHADESAKKSARKPLQSINHN
ncbi:hypothetical protein Cni_G19941 [Canna indica]|uniref:SAP domain-containing protein n=1 Tax=Canna indica TaxID=4628 RepID=A0AAQ3KMZ3_9LILI|nr:hypothetical protein Cni_G19941 [Canna indica]